MTVRKYSSRSQKTTLSASLTSVATSANVVSGTSLLGGVTLSAGETFTVVIDPDTAIEEIVDVTAVSTNTLTIVRGIETGGVGQAHSAGAEVRHMAIGRDYREANQHSENTTAAHGLTIADVVTTTNTKTLTNKTISAADNTLTGVATLTGTQTLTNKTLTSPTINGGTVAGAAVTGLSAPSAGGDAANKTYVDSILGSATSAATSAAAAAASASAASTSATNAASSATSASGSASTATTQATNASNSATAAATSATNAANSATAAANSATTATTQATAASGSASAASTSATNAANSATAAATSATSASNSATSASNSLNSVTGLTGAGVVRDMGSITDADTTTGSFISLSTLTTSAQTAATNSANSATASASSASSASTSATAAAGSASAAATSASNAAASDVSAQNWATKTSGPVAGGEYSAKYHAQAAATSATNAASSATSAANSATQAATIIGTAVSGTLIDAKGDLLVGTANDAVTRLPVGTDGYLLTADSAQTSGIKWAAAPVSLPSQTGNSGKLLTTDGTTASWSTTVNGTSIPATKTLVVTTDKLSALAATTSAELAGVISDETGTGALVFANTPTLVTPVLGAATATSINGTTIPTSATLTKTSDNLSVFAATTSAQLAGVISDETGTGSLVFATSPSLTTPSLGVATATSINGTTIPSSKTLVATDSTAYVVPSQTGNSGKYLTTNGTTSSWAAITTDPLPQIMMMMGA